MDFSYSEEQQMLQDSVSKFVSQDYDWDSRRAIVDSELGSVNSTGSCLPSWAG